jgi:hypothetical protein
VAEVAAVGQAVGRVVPAKSPANSLIRTWNVRAFDGVSPVWRSASGGSPIRDLSNVLVIAGIVRCFDLVAVQEVRCSGQAFLAMMTVLGPDWAYLVTDRRTGNSKRLPFGVWGEDQAGRAVECPLCSCPPPTTDGRLPGPDGLAGVAPTAAVGQATSRPVW